MTKSQCPTKPQILMTKSFVLACLPVGRDFGNWDLFGHWSLDIGICLGQLVIRNFIIIIIIILLLSTQTIPVHHIPPLISSHGFPSAQWLWLQS